jgi:hypothetical protein
MKGKVKCTCGWSWNKSDSSKKDMYICHECGRDNSNNMKNGGWLDNYGTQENYNDYKVSAPEGMVGDGFSNVGRNYSPAWGGSFQEGGEIPMAQKGKKVKPIYVSSKDDSRYKSYADSLYNYNLGNKLKNVVKSIPSLVEIKKGSPYDKNLQKALMKSKGKGLVDNTSNPTVDPRIKTLMSEYQKKGNKGINPIRYNSFMDDPDNATMDIITARGFTDLIGLTDARDSGYNIPEWKKPQQQVIVKPTTTTTTTIKSKTENPPSKTSKVIDREQVVPLQPMNVAGLQDVDNKFETNLNIPNPAQRQPKYYNITDVNNQNFGGGATSYRVDSLDELRELPKELWDRKITPQYQMGGNIYPVNYVPQAQEGKKLNPFTYPKPDYSYSTNPFLVRDPQFGIFIGGVNPTYSTKDFSIGASMVGVGNKDFQKLPADYGIRGSYDPTDRLSINANLSKNNIGAGLKYRFEDGGNIAQTGGSIPGAVGFSYARTQSPAPSKGPRRNQTDVTDASAQNGKEMQYYREGLDWKPKSIGQEGTQVVNSRQKRGLDLLIKETNNAKKDREELNTTGQIKKPRSLHYKKLTPKQQPTLSQDKMSVVDRQKANNAMEQVNKEQLGVLERPLIYLASPEKVLGDIGVPGMETSEEDRQKIMVNRYNPYQSNEDRLKNTIEMGLGYVPEATVNTGLAMMGMENPTVGKLANEIFNPLAGIKTSISPELRQGLQTNGIFSPEYLEGVKRTATKKLFDSRSANTEENLKRLKLFTSPKTLKAIGNVDAPIADKMLYGFMTNKYPSVKEFRTEVKKATLEANRIKKLNPGFDFSPDIFKHPDLVNHANDYLLSEPKYLSKFVNAKKAAEKTIVNKQNVKSFLEKEYVKKMDLINQDPILKNIAEESPQYVDDIYDYLKNPTKSTDEFVNDLIKQSNTFTRSMHKSMKSGQINDLDFFTPQGKSMGYSGKNTIDVEGFPTSDMRGEYGNNKYKIFPNEERMIDIASTPLEERWAKRFPDTFAGNENIDFGLGVHANVENDFLHKAITQRRIRNNMLVNSGSAPIQPKVITSEIIPNKYLYQPKHVVFNTPEADQLVKGFDVEQVSDVWNKFKPEGPFGLHPGYTKGFKQGGVIKDDMGQYNHPGEITEIDSPYITMKGVPYPVLGISDTGDMQMMYPEEEYEFDGEKVTEYPMAKNGRRQEQKGLVNLDNLLNFTNYNTKQPGGWLDTL